VEVDYPATIIQETLLSQLTKQQLPSRPGFGSADGAATPFKSHFCPTADRGWREPLQEWKDLLVMNCMWWRGMLQGEKRLLVSTGCGGGLLSGFGS
jgi:hypothetical protein